MPIPRRRSGLKLRVAVDASPDYLWEATQWVTPTTVQEKSSAKSHKAVPVPCDCGCYCGMVTADATRVCWSCRREWHHVCGRTCRAYGGELIQFGGAYEWLPDIPPRRECNGGKGWA
jgi:hypothetical protein